MNQRNVGILRLDLIALAVILLSLAVRWWFVASGQLNLIQDEAQYWDWTRRLQLSYYSKGPLIAWVITTGCKLFGSTELGVRFGSIIGMTGIQLALYLGISRVWREHRLALFTLVVAATMPMLNALGILMTTDNPLILCWTVGFFALSAATRNRPDETVSNTPFIILGITVALGILAKYMMLVFAVLAIIHALILHFRGQLPARFWSRFLIALLAGTVVGMLPIILWNMQNDWVGFRHVARQTAGKSGISHMRIGPFFEMLGAQIGLMAPWWFVLIMTGSGRAIKKSWIGPIGSFDQKYRNILQAVLFFWPLWGFITLWAIHSKTEANWTAAAFMAGSILGGVGLMKWWDAAGRRCRGRAILVGVATLLTLLMYASPLLPLPDKYNITDRLKGWQSLGKQVGEMMQSGFDDPTKVFVFSDEYDITSELAFYTPGQPLTYCAWVHDRRMNQYDLWPGPNADKMGWNAILVRERWYENNTHPLIAKMFEEISSPKLIYSTQNGHHYRKFTLRRCKDYNGFWPKQTDGRF
ncbi:ArnT family glycosyltransferase [Pseudodesulfovibrio sp.]|uniref:ArnT family glycosyltransferase n=1 Tax=unclassified Pseudodesulfovibrio TaxID=2661612 RepID=UPI003B00E221